jgi:apolipoprotein N-acyltransferase
VTLHTRRPWRGQIALPSLAAGLLLALSLPPFGWWPLAFLGAALWFFRLEGRTARTRAWSGWLVGLGCYVPGLFWAQSFNWYGALALMVVEALAMAGAGLATPPRQSLGRATAFVGANVLFEALRFTWPFGGLPIGGVFLGQAGGPFLGTARLGGPLLLTAIVYAGGAALGSFFFTWDDERTMWLHRTVVGALVALVALSTLAVVSDIAPDGGRGKRAVPVAVVQGGGRRGVSMAEVDPSTVFTAQLAATRAAAAQFRQDRVDLVVWPEDVVALDTPLAGSPQARQLSDLARRWHTTVVAGVTISSPPSPSGTFRNEVVAWGPDGRITDTFEKVHRVPFGEYVPFRGFFSHFADLSAVPLDAIAGHGTGLLHTPAGPLGVLVSYEVFYADRGRSSVRAGAELLVVPTNTSSYGTVQVPAQEVAADRVQAVSEGRDLVQAAPTGFSTVVDHRGSVVERSALAVPQVLTATVWRRSGATVYERFGDLPMLVLAVGAVGGGWVVELWRRRAAARRSRP